MATNGACDWTRKSVLCVRILLMPVNCLLCLYYRFLIFSSIRQIDAHSAHMCIVKTPRRYEKIVIERNGNKTAARRRRRDSMNKQHRGQSTRFIVEQNMNAKFILLGLKERAWKRGCWTHKKSTGYGPTKRLDEIASLYSPPSNQPPFSSVDRALCHVHTFNIGHAFQFTEQKFPWKFPPSNSTHFFHVALSVRYFFWRRSTRSLHAIRKFGWLQRWFTLTLYLRCRMENGKLNTSTFVYGKEM